MAMIVAVIVTYEPDPEKLSALLSVLAPQVNSIVIVDNGSGRGLRDDPIASDAGVIELIELKSNLGIATAQNIGIARAKEGGANFVLLSDQDSIPQDTMVSKLLTAIIKKEESGALVACVGPRYLDKRRTNLPLPFIQIRGLRLKRGVCISLDSILPVDYLIASGCLIPMTVLDQVGGMREDLFIDYVDIEWGLRARRFGYQSFGVCSALMAHSLGDQPIKFFGLSVPQHSPLRHYYHCRNAVLLYREGWIPWNWKIVDGWRLCLRYVFYSIFAKPPIEHWRMMGVGLWHGLRGRSGKYAKR